MRGDARRHHPGRARARGRGAIPAWRTRADRAAGARAHPRVPRRAADDAALSDLPRAEAPALSDPPQDRAHPRTCRDRAARDRAGRVIYISNHKSHLDYLVEPLVLDDNGIRPPVIAAGINLFGGPLGLIHRHVTGAIPIRPEHQGPRVSRHAEGLRRRAAAAHDLLFYIEGGRSYSGELKPPKTGLLHAALQAERDDVGDRADGGRLRSRARGSHPRAPGDQAAPAPVRARVAEMVRYAVGYQSRAVRHLRPADPARRLRPGVAPRRDGRWRTTRDTIGTLYKVLPTAVVAAAMRPSITRRDLEARVDAIIETRAPAAPTWASARDARRSTAAPSRSRAQHHPHRARRTLPRSRADRASLLRAHDPAPARRRRPPRTH